MLQNCKRYLRLVILLFVLSYTDCPAYSYSAAQQRQYDLQRKATVLAHEVRQGVVTTNYNQLISALQQLDDAQQVPVDQLVDPLTPLHELIQAMNVAGREYFLVPELKLRIAQVAHRSAQRIYLAVHTQKRPIAKDTKTTMLQCLNTTLSLLELCRAPVTPVLFHLRYVRAVVDNLPDNTSALQTGTHILLKLVKITLDKDIEAGLDMLKGLVVKGQKLYRGRLVEELTAAELLGKIVLQQGYLQAFSELIGLYKNTQLEETQYAVIQALGRMARACYSEQSTLSNNKETAQQAYSAFSTLLEVATPKRSYSQ